MTATYWNEHEHAARAAKVAKLVDAFVGHANKADGSADPVPAPVLAGMAQAATDELWRDLAILAGIRPPSAATVAQARASLAIRAREAGLDPLRGLPQ